MLKLVYKTLPYPSAPKSIVKGAARPNIPEIMEKHPGPYTEFIFLAQNFHKIFRNLLKLERKPLKVSSVPMLS